MTTQTAPRQTASDIDALALAAELQRRHEASTSAEARKQRGQFFTPTGIADYMAGLLSSRGKRLRVLDPGAGTGTLSAAVCARVARLRAPRSIELVLFETDPNVLPLLGENLRHCARNLRDAGHQLHYVVHADDFVLSNREVFGQSTLFGDGAGFGEFDAVIMNPPYFKLNKASAHARAFAEVIEGQPNIYALFMATAAAMLRPGGEMVAITPRSFCSGLYFREFRRWFFERMTLRQVHLFESRTEAFAGADVLQESIITSWVRGGGADERVRISTSHGADLAGADETAAYPRKQIVDQASGDLVVRIPSSRVDALVMAAVESWPMRFADHGLCISTGPVVLFRATKYLSANGKADGVPLLHPHNVRPFETCWPVEKKGKPLALRSCTGSEKLLVPSRNYVLVKRFSAKEERRRLTAGCFLGHDGGWPAEIAIENHVNYVYHARRELSEAETYGLAALFNSALLDRYFRTLSGNTQVNATEIRTMPFPDLATIAQIGAAVRKIDIAECGAVERVVLRVLEINGSLARELTRDSK